MLPISDISSKSGNYEIKIWEIYDSDDADQHRIRRVEPRVAGITSTDKNFKILLEI
jgi:hypothetical protein